MYGDREGNEGRHGVGLYIDLEDERRVDEVLYRNIAARMRRAARAELPGGGPRYGPINAGHASLSITERCSVREYRPL